MSLLNDNDNRFKKGHNNVHFETDSLELQNCRRNTKQLNFKVIITALFLAL